MDIRVDAATDLSALRADIEHALTTSVPDSDTRHAIVLSATELLTNALSHGEPPVHLRVSRSTGTPKTLEVSVTDHGHGTTTVPTTRPEPDAERGRGLWLVSQLADSLSLVTHRGWFTAQASFATLTQPAAAARPPP